MSEKLVVACVQQRMRLPHTVDDYRNDLTRFMRAAQNKNARLVVFPELAGLMVALPLLADVRSGLLKRADRGRRRHANLWQRANGALAGSMASVLRADLRVSVGRSAGCLSLRSLALLHDRLRRTGTRVQHDHRRAFGLSCRTRSTASSAT